MIPKIVKYAPDSIYLVVSNPVDILTYFTYKISKKDPKKIIGSGTVLDTARFRYLLAEHCNVNASNVHAYILGEHGDSEFAVWSRATIGATMLGEFCPMCENYDKCECDKELDKIFNEVKDKIRGVGSNG